METNSLARHLVREGIRTKPAVAGELPSEALNSLSNTVGRSWLFDLFL